MEVISLLLLLVTKKKLNITHHWLLFKPNTFRKKNET